MGSAKTQAQDSKSRTRRVNETRAKFAVEKRLVRNNSSRRWLQGSAAAALTSQEQSNFKTVRFRSSRFQERILRLRSSLVYCLDRKIGSRPVFTLARTMRHFVSPLLFLCPRVSSYSNGSRRTSSAVSHNSKQLSGQKSFSVRGTARALPNISKLSLAAR